MWGDLSDKRTDLSFTTAAGPRQRSHYFTIRDSRLPQHRGPGPRIFIPQEQGGPVIPPGTGFSFRVPYETGYIVTRLVTINVSRWSLSHGVSYVD
jgi:hypothetical protein